MTNRTLKDITSDWKPAEPDALRKIADMQEDEERCDVAGVETAVFRRSAMIMDEQLARILADAARIAALEAEVGMLKTEKHADAEAIGTLEHQVKAAGEVVVEAQNLQSRISGWVADHLNDDNFRDWNGHVQPPLDRLRAALSAFDKVRGR